VPDAPLLEPELTIAYAPIATAMAAVPMATDLVSFRENIERLLRRWG
jgi:hypothetical protein